MLKKRLPVITMFLVAIVASVAALAYIFWTRTGYGPSANVAASQYRQWATNGLPVTQDQLYQEPLAAEDDALPELQRAVSYFKNLGRPGGKGEVGREEEEFENGAVAAHIAKMKPVLDEAHTAAQKSSCRFVRDYDEGGGVIYPEFSDFKLIAKTLAWDAELRAKKGDWKGAAKNIRTARRLGSFTAQDVAIIPALVSIAIDAIALDGAARAASHLVDNPQGLAAIRTAVEESSFLPDVDRVLRGDAYVALSSFRSLDDKQILRLIDGEEMVIYEASEKPVRDGLPGPLLARAAAGEAMTYWNKFYPRLTAPGADLRAIGQEMDVRQLEMTKGTQPEKAATMIIGTYSEFFTALAKQQSQEAALISYVGVLQFQSRESRWPKSLAEAGVEGLDVISHKPLGYRSEEGSFRVWHVGSNGVDDGGLSYKEAAAKGSAPEDLGDGVIAFPPSKRAPTPP